MNGAVRIEVTLEDDRLFEPGRHVKLAGNAERETEVEFFRRQHGHCIVKFRGIDHISEAERLVGAEIKVAADQLNPLQEGWFYTFQLKGCRIVTPDGETLGTVINVLDSGGTPILKVEGREGEILIPFAQAFLRNMDLGRRRIEMTLPDGLRDLNK